MVATTPIDFDALARRLQVSVAALTATVEMLDDAHSVPFITRYRKDQTGGLDEEKIREIQQEVLRLRALEDRQQKVLKVIESRQKLSAELEAKIRNAATVKELEEIYLPFRPKKQTLATLARQRGLDALADQVLQVDSPLPDLKAAATAYVSGEEGLISAEQVLGGVGHLLAEGFHERIDLRAKLHAMYWETGVLRSERMEESSVEASLDPAAATSDAMDRDLLEHDAATASDPDSGEEAASGGDAGDRDALEASDVPVSSTSPEISDTPAETSSTTLSADSQSVELASSASSALPNPAQVPSKNADQKREPRKPGSPIGSMRALAIERKKSKRAAKHKKRERLVQSFKDYFRYSEPMRKIQHHRILAINRGERSRILRVVIEVDQQRMRDTAEQMLVPTDHPHREFLLGVVRDAMQRLILPSIEREVRRELTEAAESHAITVFARNLRSLLLQPPLRHQRILAVDPGFRSGCKLVALDECGNVLAQGVVHLIGSDERCRKGRSEFVELVRAHSLKGIAIGNGTACREAERMVADLLANELKDVDGGYTIVNEAGASVYSTSQVGREELPQLDATLRGAVSIGRRLQDPLSELVKINPANIGVGLYQHDVKSRPLSTTLDAVVESGVNFVGVDLNTASPSLLRYVSGLNQLTARRIVEFRQQNGRFRSRTQLREVPGVGEATFVQAAGFLKITDGDNLLDATWIHPESYSTVEKILDKLNISLSELVQHLSSRLPQADWQESSRPVNESGDTKPEDGKTGDSRPGDIATRLSQWNVAEMAAQLGVGELTLTDILSALSRPPRDPREDLPKPVFRREVVKLEDLRPGMQLAGTVLNVVDFGAFVDIGLSDCGLVHVSRLADRFVADPHDIVTPGDILQVWVVNVDKERRRVSLTAVQPGTEKPRPERNPKPPQAQQERRPQHKPHATRPVQSPRHERPKRGKTIVAKSPKPVVPITEAMRDGKEPMRTFGDLMQFFDASGAPRTGARDSHTRKKPGRADGDAPTQGKS